MSGTPTLDRSPPCVLPAKWCLGLAPWGTQGLGPGTRPEGLRGSLSEACIPHTDAQWHHVAWQYSHVSESHELWLDGRCVWEATRPDGVRLVNDREHDAQFSVGTRLQVSVQHNYWLYCFADEPLTSELPRASVVRGMRATGASSIGWDTAISTATWARYASPTCNGMVATDRCGSVFTLCCASAGASVFVFGKKWRL